MYLKAAITGWIKERMTTTNPRAGWGFFLNKRNIHISTSYNYQIIKYRTKTDKKIVQFMQYIHKLLC